MQVFNERICKTKFDIFHEILKATGGRYLGKVREFDDYVKVDYEPGEGHAEAWRRANLRIVEVNPTLIQRIARLLRRKFN